ncbi:MAG: STAS domain-containing protein [SAR324 cluster bacterium]|nr:STAS domain-containing protein [SAR324 cluster bacterium]
MKVSHRIVGNLAILKIEAESLNFENINTLKQYVQTLLDDQNPETVILNMEHIIFMDSSGMGAIVTHYKNFLKIRKNFYLCSLNPLVYQVFEFSGLNKLIKIFPDENSMLKELQ